MKQSAGAVGPPEAAHEAHHGVELRHLRYLVAVADAGTFTHAAERMLIAQPTLSQQIRRLEEMVGAPLLDRRRDGVQLTDAGSALLEESRTVLSLMDHGMRRTRQVAGLDRERLRFVLPPHLPEGLAADTAARLWSVAAAAGVDVTWLEAPLDPGFALIRRRQADAALGWVTSDPAALPDPLDAMTLCQFEPAVWIPARSGGSDRIPMGLEELADMDVVHGPRRASPGTYDAWLGVLRSARPRFEFIDPPVRDSLPVALAFAATADRLTAVLTSPLRAAAGETRADARQRAADPYDMVRVRLDRPLLTATAAVAWNGDLPRYLQQVLFDAADGVALAAAS
ncbi:MAG TPA: LysR family transcriptional regulator [Trebonia sp.]|nr:LysR family transcriptional regulator [Trebonia sp.]